MISENDRKILYEAERECNRKLSIIWSRFKKSAKFLGAIGICLALYSCRHLGLGTFLMVSMLPLLAGMIVELCMAETVLRKYLRICKAILGGPDDDPDPDDEEKVPESTKNNSPKSNVSPLFPSSQKEKKVA